MIHSLPSLVCHHRAYRYALHMLTYAPGELLPSVTSHVPCGTSHAASLSSSSIPFKNCLSEGRRRNISLFLPPGSLESRGRRVPTDPLVDQR